MGVWLWVNPLFYRLNASIFRSCELLTAITLFCPENSNTYVSVSCVVSPHSSENYLSLREKNFHVFFRAEHTFVIQSSLCVQATI